jgi:hypothetical protein
LGSVMGSAGTEGFGVGSGVELSREMEVSVSRPTVSSTPAGQTACEVQSLGAASLGASSWSAGHQHAAGCRMWVYPEGSALSMDVGCRCVVGYGAKVIHCRSSTVEQMDWPALLVVRRVPLQ